MLEITINWQINYILIRVPRLRWMLHWTGRTYIVQHIKHIYKIRVMTLNNYITPSMLRIPCTHVVL
jgi:hypothetical protein